MDHKQTMTELFERYLKGEATKQETETLFNYFDTPEGSLHASELVEVRFQADLKNDDGLLAKVIPMADRVGERLKLLAAQENKPIKLWNRRYISIAVAACAMLALANWLYIQKVAIPEEIQRNRTVQLDANPGTSRATLTLGNGQKINLDAAATGQIARQASVQIAKTADGQIIYTVSGGSHSSETKNSITTPKGGQYQVRLPDGSKVWLNAASTLTYATDLSISKKRVVQLGGEAYFEVAHDKARPFIVKTATEEIEVLGTHFNVNSYGDNARTATTLEEGSVKVSTAKSSQLLKPGQQAIQQENMLKVQQADMESALAWKNGNMVFKSEPLENIMKQVERWYDIEVLYQGQVRKRVFTGGISRNSKLSVLLNILKDSGINFELKETPQGKALLIKP